MISSARNMAVTARQALRRLHREHGAQVGYIGGHGGGNLGDDLMLDIATELFPGRRLVDLAESWHERRLARVGLSGPQYFEHVLLGGGTLISPFWFGKVEAAVQQGLGISTLGTGVGSCGFIQRDDIDLSAWAPLVRAFRHLGVRGPRSKRRLEEMGAGQAEVVGDLAMYLTFDEPAAPSDPPIIAVNLSIPADDEPASGETERFDELREALRGYVRSGWWIRGYAMNPRDVAPTRALLERLGVDDAQTPHLSGIDEFFERVGPVTLNVAVRLHGAILGCCAGVPPLMLGYRDKCLDFAESMGLNDACVHLPTARPGDLAERLRHVAGEAPRRRGDVIAAARKLKVRLSEYAGRIARELD